MRRGIDVPRAVAELAPDLVMLDLQIGNMGGMATCMALRLESGAGRLPHVPVLMLLDRDADIFLARRSDADGWLIKPLDAFRLRKAADGAARRRHATPRASPKTPANRSACSRVSTPESVRSGEVRLRRTTSRRVQSTAPRGVAQFGSALRSGRRGRGFKSRLPDHRSPGQSRCRPCWPHRALPVWHIFDTCGSASPLCGPVHGGHRGSGSWLTVLGRGSGTWATVAPVPG